MRSGVKEKVCLEGRSQLSRGGKKTKVWSRRQSMHGIGARGAVSKRVRSPASLTCLGEIIIWKNSFSFLFEYNQKHKKFHQYGNHISLKEKEGKFSEEIPKSTD